MFGFVKAPCSSCSKDQASEYRSWFCGLGCALSRDYTPLARFLVNHDSTFLAIAAEGEAPATSPPTFRTCCNPLARPRPVFSESWATRYAAAVTLCALRVKADDEVADERGTRRQLGRAALAISTPAAGRATALLNTLGFPSRKVWETMEARAFLETPTAGLREAASPTAEAYREIFQFPAQHFGGAMGTRSSLATLGESMGRLVYWKDALDDREEDAKEGRYNPLQHHREGRLRDRLAAEAGRFRAAAASLGTGAPILPTLAARTTDFHFARPAEEDRKRREDKGKWYDSCCDCSACDCCDCCGSSSSKGKKSCGGLDDCSNCDCDCGGCDCGGCDCCPCDCS